MTATLPELTMHAVAGAAESLDIVLEITPDPTGATPTFALTLAGDYAPPIPAFVPGTWGDGAAWDPDTRRITATTPTIGTIGLLLTRGKSHWLWHRIDIAGEILLTRVAVIICP